MAKTETKVLERMYNVPLRKEYQKAPRYKRTKKAVAALREFLARHMKATSVKLVKLGPAVNEKLWEKGIKKPPHHVKVTVTKNEKGEVFAELFGVKKEEVRVAKRVKEKKKEVAEVKAVEKEESSENSQPEKSQ